MDPVDQVDQVDPVDLQAQKSTRMETYESPSHHLETVKT